MQESNTSKPNEFLTAVTAATVYTDRALLTRSAPTSIEAGKQTLYFDHFPQDLVEDSLRVTGSGDAALSIEDFKIHTKHFREVPESRVHTLIEEKEKLVRQKKQHAAELSVIDEQKVFLKEIRVHSTESISKDFERRKPETSDWKETLTFLGAESNELNLEMLAIQDKMESIDEEIKLIDQSLNQAANIKNKVRKQVQVEVDASTQGDFTFEISYLIHQARWSPTYDARVNSAEKKVTLRYYGAVTQTTGEDWTDVQVTLSTARPHIGGNAPQLHPWSLNLHQDLHMDMMMDEAVSASAPAAPRRMKKSAPRSVGGNRSQEMAYGQTQVVGGEGASVLFTPLGKSDIPGNGSTGKLLVMEQEFDSEFNYLTLPKLNKYVYLTAKITNTSEFPLLPGQISIFKDNSFVSKSHLTELVTPDEKFELSLGVDESIKVKHKLKKQFGDEKGLFNKSKVTQYAYHIELNNQRDTEETVTVRDQIPVSQDDEIKVKLDQISPAEHADKNKDELPAGALEWKITLPARSKQPIEFSFSVSHGKDTRIDGM